jgi:hypothetical protein
MDLSKTLEAAKREAAAMDDGERRTLLARIDELDRHGQRWKRERDEVESDLARVRRERDRLKKCVADMEADCACLPEDRSVTETVTALSTVPDVLAVDGYINPRNLNAEDIFSATGNLLIAPLPYDDDIPVRILVLRREGEK